MVLILLLFLFPPGIDGLNPEPSQFLHKTPSSELQKLFTAGPLDHEIDLDFNVDSREDSHNDIRRSVPEVWTADMGIIPLEELKKQQETSRHARSTGPSFDQPAYDFMIPAGKHENSTLLAILKFSTPLASVATFNVTMDRLKWFEIKEVNRKQNGDKFDFDVPVLLAEGADVRPELTKNSVYKFNIEASQGSVKASSRVRVEVFSFGPTTKKVKTTTEETHTTAKMVEGSAEEPLVLTANPTVLVTTTVAQENSAILVNTNQEKEEISDEGKQINSSQESTVTQDAGKAHEDTVPNETVAVTVSQKTEEGTMRQKDKEVLTEKTVEITASSLENSEPHNTVTGDHNRKTQENTVMQEGIILTETTPVLQEITLTTVSPFPETTIEQATATQTSTEFTTIPQSSQESKETMADDQLLTTISSRKLPHRSKKRKGINRMKIASPKVEVEGSGDGGRSQEKLSTSVEQDDDDPLSEVVTVATPILQKEIEKGVDIKIDGTQNGLFVIEGTLNRGDMIRGLIISATSKSENTDWLKVSTNRPELFSVRPGRIEPGGMAYLFSNHPELVGDVEIKIIVSDGPIIDEETITIRHNRVQESSSSMKMDLSVAEDTPSGTIIGHIDNGEQMKIVGKAGLFTLVGSDIILSCSSEAPCLDYETQHVHYLLLVAKDGSGKTLKIFIQVLDINDNTPLIETTDAVIRVSDGQLIMPFAIQIEDEDTPAVQQNELSTAGDAANFLELEKVDVDLYQIRIKGSPSPGRYELILRVDDGVHHSRKTHKTVKVLVQNSHSHAHFRRARYDRNVTPERIMPGVEVVRVELEGIPIDEAKFVILEGNPGWLTIDDYGGTVTFTRPTRTPVPDLYEVIVAALGRNSGKILAQTTLSITVLGTPQVKKVFDKTVYERTVDRETPEGISTSFGIKSYQSHSPIEVDAATVLAIDEDGLQKDLEPGAISVRGDRISISKEAAANLRVIRMNIRSGQEKATLIFHLTSSNAYLENKRKVASKPLFPALPQTLEVAEELPIGHIVSTLPAVHPITGEAIPVKLEGGDQAFMLDSATGTLKIAKSMNYDDPTNPKKMELKFIAGEEGYETTAKMTIRIVDVDNNPPVINKEALPGKVVIPENLSVNTVILRVPVTDVDEISLREGLKSSLKDSSGLFKTVITNGTVILQLAGELDREKMAQHVLQLIVEDQAGHKDYATVTIELSDVNDNSPKFTKEVYDVQAVENWPAGLVLETLLAQDQDSLERGQITYFLESQNSKYFSLETTTGKLKISQDLMGLARDEPYMLTAVATDGGDPPRNSTVPIKITVLEPRKNNQAQLKFISPPANYRLELSDHLQPNDKLYQAKARVEGDGRNVKYSLQELFVEESAFGIDEMSGELIAKKELERRGEHIVS